MTLRVSQLGSAKRRILTSLTSVSPVRYGVSAIIVLTLAYSTLHIIPMVKSDLRLLNDLYALDIKGMALESDLRSGIQESRGKFQQILLLQNDSPQWKEEMQSMQAIDASIVQTQTEISQLGIVSDNDQKSFAQSWSNFISIRDKQVATTVTGSRRQARTIDSDPAQVPFLLAEQAVQNAQANLRVASAVRIQQISGTLVGTLRELFLLVAIKIIVLSLFIWLDWKRIRVEKKLEQTTKELLASEDRFRHAYESASVGMGIFKIDGTVISANRMAAKILGCEVEELIGKKVSDFIAPEFREDHLQRISSLPKSPQNSYQVERRVIRRDGTAAWVRNSVTLLKPEG